MFKKTKASYYKLGAAMTAGMIAASSTAHAGGNNFSSIASNITASIGSLPALLSALAYMFGILLGVLGIMKIKDHVENPTQTPLKDGCIRLAAGGALFALPIVFEAMFETTGTGLGASAATLNGVQFNTGT
tara:strand:- start:2362 stop:2754 length:393 start_codon:yes stop_codon:yes gene_type:complete